MKKTLIALTAASALAVGTIAVPQKAEAHAWWVIPSIIVGTAVVGGAVIAGSQAYAHPRYAGAPVTGGAARFTSRRRATAICRSSPALFGGYRYVEVCR
jgi:hypothetical protein